jgi:hypothetical protein
MQTEIIDTPFAAPRARVPLWYWTAAGLGLAWNAFGITRFFGSAMAGEADLLAQGLTAEQAALYASLPAWMDAAFAIGVLSGLIGCILLATRGKFAFPVFVASLAGYVALYAGDLAYGVFTAFGAGQAVILTLVVAIAVALLWVARHAAIKSYLR